MAKSLLSDLFGKFEGEDSTFWLALLLFAGYYYLRNQREKEAKAKDAYAEE